MRLASAAANEYFERMRLRTEGRRLAAFALALTGMVTSCGSNDQVAPSAYGSDADAQPGQQGPDGATAQEGAPAPESDGSPAISIDSGPGTPTSPSCNMNGRWLVAQRVLAQALGQTQASHNWFYYEISQNGNQLTVTKGLNCGFDVVHVSALGADVDSHLAWPALLAHNSDAGRKGTMEVTASGCQLDVEKRYTVRGATISFYSDPNQAMPTTSEQASGSTPGWEDWDGDGNPGITLSVSGAASGDLYCAQRDWNQWTGSVAAGSTTFSVPVTWDAGQDALGYSGSSLVTQSAAPDTDATQHYVWFAKLDETQAIGDDTAICASVRTLVPMLTPAALK